MVYIRMFFVLTISTFTFAFVPRQCIKNITNLNSGICCPIPKGYMTPCGHPSRGRCQEIVNNELSLGRFINEFTEDIRFQWPLKIFKYFCQCQFRFDGVDCGGCSPGFRGRECLEKRKKVRRNILNYGKEDLFILRSVLNMTRYFQSSKMVIEESTGMPFDKSRLVNVSLHDYLVFIHQFAARQLVCNIRLCNETMVLGEYTNHNHNGPGFLTWHRYFMLEWERISSELAETHHKVNDFAFPYWDWSDRRGCEVCTNDKVGDSTDVERLGNELSCDSHFHDWTETCGGVATNPCLPCTFKRPNKRITRRWLSLDFPTKEQIQFALRLSHYYPNSFIRRFAKINGQSVSIHRILDPCHSFASFLEGDCLIGGELSMHNKMHNIVQGTFGLTRTAVNDPLFILHHIQVDRIFESWLRNHEESVSTLFPEKVFAESQCYNCFMVGFLPPVKHKQVFKSSILLGYDYDNLRF